MPSVTRPAQATRPAPLTVTHNGRELRVADQHLLDALNGTAFLLLDGAMGTQLQERGLDAGSLPELLCLTDPAAVTDVHRGYVEAGSEVVTANTFGANALKLGDAATVEEVFAAAIACARASGARYVAADLGPTGSLLQPMGTLSFDEAYELFVKEVAQRFRKDLSKTKTVYDLCSCLVSILLSFLFFGFGRFEGVKLGTVFCALVNGWLIGQCSRWLETRFDFRDSLPGREMFSK